MFLYVVLQPNWKLGWLFVEVPRSNTVRHTHTHTVGRTPLIQWPARHRGRYTQDTHKTKELYIHDSIWIRSLDPRMQHAGELIIRPLSNRDRRGHITFCLHLYWSTNVIECGYVEIIRDANTNTKKKFGFITWCFSDRASWIDYILTLWRRNFLLNFSTLCI